MATIQHVDREHTARALADLLNGNARRRPVVVVTIPSGRAEPWIDAERIAHEAGSLAEVYLMPTGAPTWEFSKWMAEGTQVYGGAGRVYPVGHEWTRDVMRSPLRFAFNAEDGERATRMLISDTLRLTAAAGLVQTGPTGRPRQVSGVVRNTVAGRALVTLDDSTLATIAEELVVEDVSIERLLQPGQRVEGSFDPESKRFDVRAGLRPAEEALAGYAVGDVVLTRVAMVRNGKAELVLYPKTSTPEVSVAVLRVQVTTNPLDDLRTLMTVGEVIPARVMATGPAWELVLHDVDDDEQQVPAPALLPGGPPWLVAEAPDEFEADESHPQVSLPSQRPLLEPEEPELESEEVADPDSEVGSEPGSEPDSGPVRAAPPRPSPVMLDRNRPRPAGVRAAQAAQAHPSAPARPTVPAQPSESTRALLLKIDGLRAEINALARERVELRTQLHAGADEREQLHYLLGQAERRANRAENDLRAARSRLRKAGNTKQAPAPVAGPRFADPEQGFRYLVLTQWATRTGLSEQAERPLPDYLIGPRFLDSLARLEGIRPEKVADVVFEIVTGLAPQMPAREVHRLRTGPSGDTPVRTREDGSVAWRASLQVHTPSARRIHYWILPDGRIELSQVATHDDFDA